MPNIKYVGKNLFIEKLSVANIAKKNGTPFYIYSENQIKENYIKFLVLGKCNKRMQVGESSIGRFYSCLMHSAFKLSH